MRTTMVIPSYWGRASGIGWREDDDVYDHPTPLDDEGTLLRALRSMEVLEDHDFHVVVIAVATAKDIENRVETRLAGVIKSASEHIGIDMSLFGPSKLRQIHELLIRKGKGKYTDLLRLNGYSNVRNLCLFLPHIFESDVALLIDDDEVFEDPGFMGKAKEHIGRAIGGIAINAVAGYYLQPDGDYHVKKSMNPWMKHWGQYDSMNEAFEAVIGTEPRLKETPFVFGGNMVIHRNLYTVVPFDPNVARGEDIDYLINARMFGFPFFLDNQLAIKHLPPPKTHPEWMQLRQDIYRFVYERAKLDNQREVDHMTRVYPEDLDPYPGRFLKRDLEKMVKESCRALSEEYLAQGDIWGSQEALNNIGLAETDALPKHDPFQSLCLVQRRWQELMQYTSKDDIRLRLKEIIQVEFGT